MTKTILVTGGAGYIGSHTCKYLSQNGYYPVVLDNLSYGHKWAVKWGPFVEGDIRNENLLDKVFKEFRPAAVIHFAAFAYVGESVSDPGKYYKNNVSGTLSLLDAMRRNNCRNIIFSSSCAIYGIPETVPIYEEHPQNPINPYGQSKLMIEQILKDFDSAYGLKHVALRYFNAAGADMEGEIGEDHYPEAHLIPLTIFSALDRRTNLEIYGTDYPTKDGTAIRDYIHVADLAKAHVLSLGFLMKEKQSENFNLGTGQGHSVTEIVDAVKEVSGNKVPVKEGPRRPGDPPVLVAQAKKAKTVLGWTPEYIDIKTVVASAWRWHHACKAQREGLK